MRISRHLLLALLVACVWLPTAAQADTPPVQTADGQWQYTWSCGNGETVEYTVDHQLTPDEETQLRAEQCSSDSAPVPKAAPAPKRLALKIDTKSLLEETLVDLRANRFVVRLRCSRACSVGALLQIGWDAGHGKARVLTVASKPRRLPGAKFVAVPLHLSGSQLAAVRAARADVHVRGFERARASDDGATTYAGWTRTCPVHQH